MDKIFLVIRKLHLYASFVIASFLLMYFLSGAIMIMENIFPRKNVKTLSEKVALKSNKAEAEAINEISSRYNIHGRESNITNANGGRNYTFIRPAYRADIIFVEGKDSIKVNIKEGTFWSAMNDFHRLRGYAGSWTHKVWAMLYDLSCIALLVFAFTGVYLWWKLERKKRLGTIFIFASTGITVFTIWYLMAVC